MEGLIHILSPSMCASREKLCCCQHLKNNFHFLYNILWQNFCICPLSCWAMMWLLSFAFLMDTTAHTYPVPQLYDGKLPNVFSRAILISNMLSHGCTIVSLNPVHIFLRQFILFTDTFYLLLPFVILYVLFHKPSYDQVCQLSPHSLLNMPNAVYSDMVLSG